MGVRVLVVVACVSSANPVWCRGMCHQWSICLFTFRVPLVGRRRRAAAACERVGCKAYSPRRPRVWEKTLEGREDAFRRPHLLAHYPCLRDHFSLRMEHCWRNAACAPTAVSSDSGTSTVDALPVYIKRRPTRFIPDHGKRYPVVMGLLVLRGYKNCYCGM